MIPSVARMEQARAACTEALKTDELAAAIEFLAGRGFSADRCLDLLRTTAEVQVAVADLVELKRSALASSGPVAQPAVLERSLLIQGALRAVDKIQDLPVDESVKKMFFKEFALYASPPVGAEDRFALTSFSFISMCRIICQLRFPGGLLHWERSGFPRSWLKKIPRRFLLRTLRFILFEARGFKPYMVWHLGGTVQKFPFLLEREVRKSFYRMAAAAELQPEVKALMAGSWLISRETHRVSPHLEVLVRPFLEAGGIYTERGPAHIADGFLAGDEVRKKLYEAGEYQPAFGVVICTREQAIAWKRTNEGLAAELDGR